MTAPTTQFLQSLAEKADPLHCALLIVDMQNDFLHPEGKARKEGARELGPMLEIVPRQVALVESARHAGVPVLFVMQTTLPGDASNSDVWLEARSRARYSGTDMCLEGSWGQQLIEELPPKSSDHLVKKYRYSGFVGTNLDLILRSLDRRTVVLAGTSTNVCVEATAWDAFHHGYYTVYAKDACASWDMSLHDATLRTAATRYASVESVEDILATWSSKPRSAKQ